MCGVGCVAGEGKRLIGRGGDAQLFAARMQVYWRGRGGEWATPVVGSSDGSGTIGEVPLPLPLAVPGDMSEMVSMCSSAAVRSSVAWLTRARIRRTRSNRGWERCG